MCTIRYKHHQLRQLGRWLVVVFVISWLNIAFQVPVHAAMMQQKASSSQMDMSGMNCHCPPALCDTILSLDDQSMDGVSFFNAADFEFTGIFVSIIKENLGTLSQLGLVHSDMVFRDTSPPPILLNTILLI
ncbi:MAG: hypothetical protein OEY61_08190 [Gammaproteobacteria bacterium]|nr:hypothetical protein [Gammaproteobacteria bacterium]